MQKIIKYPNYKPFPCSSGIISRIGYLLDTLYSKTEWRLVENKEIKQSLFSLRFNNLMKETGYILQEKHLSPLFTIYETAIKKKVSPRDPQ